MDSDETVEPFVHICVRRPILCHIPYFGNRYYHFHMSKPLKYYNPDDLAALSGWRVDVWRDKWPHEI